MAENWPEEIQSDGWPKNGTRRAREEEERRRDDGELSFHFPSVWLLDGEGHYSLKEYPTPPAHCPPFLFVVLRLSLFTLSIYLSSVFVFCVINSVFHDVYCTVK